MPTVRIFGQEIERKTLIIGGGLIAAAVAVVVWLRARAASTATAEAPAAQPDQGYGMSVPAPSGAVADQYQQQLDNSQLEAQKIANTYQSNLVTQQQKQFDFQQSIQQALAPAYLSEQSSELAVQTHFNTAASKAAVSCPGNASLRTGPDGQLYCRQKTSGSFLGIPVGDIVRSVQGFVSGVEAAAPSIGYNAAQQAAAYETGRVFPLGAAKQGLNPTAQARTSTPGIAPKPLPALSAFHGYSEVT